MKIHEYQARELLEQYGIAVPRGELASTPEEASAVTRAWGGNAVIKAQVLTGGRGKAGAIRVVSSQAEAESAAREILAMSVKDFDVKHVLITERLDIRAEYYAAITVDRETRTTVLIISAAGGMDIEEIAAKEPEKIRRITMHGAEESQNSEDLAQWLSTSFPDQTLLGQAAEIVRNMNRLFRDKDCSLVEINPLAVTAQGRLIAADAKIVFDDNAIAQHPEIAGLRNPEEYTADEIEAKDAGLSFVSLSGEIGCMVNGAGLAMATMDGIKLAGGSPANFLDVGGSSNPQKVLDAMRILLRNDQLKVILVNIFGGITRCDDVAQGILMARDKLGIAVPMVIRLIGTNEEKGRKMLSEAGLIVASRMTDAVRDAVNCTRGGSQP
ncbi:MAG: ADP-forming succinate--CoA ligase subunit beta [Planctomycetota bacterium]